MKNIRARFLVLAIPAALAALNSFGRAEGLRIVRDLWLEERGRGLTFRDQITGRTQQNSRLDAAVGQNLGSVRSGERPQLITRNPQNGAPGVEVRAHDFDFVAIGRMALTKELSATGWRSTADKLSVTLNLPPGWRLFALFGADWVRGDWLTAWAPLHLFVLFVFSLAVFRFWGAGAGLLAFAALGFSYHEPGAPRCLWLVLLAALALQGVAPKGRGQRALGLGKWVIVTVFAVVLGSFVMLQAGQAIYPQSDIVREGRWTFFPGLIVAGEPALAVRAMDENAPPLIPTSAEQAEDADAARGDLIMEKLERIIIPKLELREASIRESIDFLEKSSVDLDQNTPAGEKGINIVLKLDPKGGAASPPQTPAPTAAAIPGAEAIPSAAATLDGSAASSVNPAEARVTVSLTDIPLIEALRYVTSLAGLKFKVKPYGVLVVPQSVNTDVLFTKEWQVRPDLLLLPNPGAPDAAKNWLISNGIQFDWPGRSAIYIPQTSRLIVRNTQDQLDIIDTIFPDVVSTPSTFSSRSPDIAKDDLGYEAKARIQTGPGVPERKWREVSFGWNGPVSASHKVRPVLIPPNLERVLTVIRVLLLLILAVLLLGGPKIRGSVFPVGGKAAAALAFVGMMATRYSTR
jgi:hypothetical protein